MIIWATMRAEWLLSKREFFFFVLISGKTRFWSKKIKESCSQEEIFASFWDVNSSRSSNLPPQTYCKIMCIPRTCASKTINVRSQPTIKGTRPRAFKCHPMAYSGRLFDAPFLAFLQFLRLQNKLFFKINDLTIFPRSFVTLLIFPL